MALAYQHFLEDWTVADVNSNLRRAARRHRYTLLEAAAKLVGRPPAQVTLAQLVGLVPDRVLFDYYDDYASEVA